MANLRESNLLERARKIYNISRARRDADEAIDMIRDILRITRDEGIKTGHDQAERFSHLEKAS